MSRRSPGDICLAVGELYFQLRCADADLERRLAHLYRAFLSSEPQPPHLHAELVVETPIVPHAPLEPAFTFERGRLRLAGPGVVEGWVDAGRKTGRLVLNTSCAVAYAEYFLRAACALVAFEAGGLLLHAAGVVRGGRAYLFLGPSGSGKTTVTSFASPGDRVLNDDLVVVRPEGGGWRAYATPFSSPPGREEFRPGSARVAGLFRLVQSRDVVAIPLAPAQAVAELAANAPVICADRGRGAALLGRCAALADQVPAHALHFRRDPSFWDAVERAALSVP